jgi:alkanesulfonate monooxygenase SsuD/methylene tetrahydromethanopterin reductase-like flavin-dependent oxidoreductase (luciferase family)
MPVPDMVVDVQLSPTGADWSRFLDAVLAAESAGFGAVWVFDHLAGRSVRSDRMYECFTCLGALSVATTRIELGSLVTNVWNREPGVLAVAAATVTEISGRQLFLGLGAGTSPTSAFAFEQRVVGAFIAPTLAERHARVERALDLFDEMWSPDRDDGFTSFLRPDPRPLTIVGVNSVRLSAIAGRRADGINVAWSHPRRTEFLDAASAARPEGSPFIVTAYDWWDDALLDPDHPERRRMVEAGVERLILADLGPPDPDHLARCRP